MNKKIYLYNKKKAKELKNKMNFQTFLKIKE